MGLTNISHGNLAFVVCIYEHNILCSYIATYYMKPNYHEKIFVKPTKVLLSM